MTNTCTCSEWYRPDPWCPDHATCGACGAPVVILDKDDLAFCPTCRHDVAPTGVCRFSQVTE